MPLYFTICSKKREEKMMNVIDFKIILVKSLIVPKLDGVPGARSEHKVMRSESRNQCAYCVMFCKSKCTRFKCGEPTWNIPIFMWDMMWQSMTAVITHTEMIKFFGQHMQNMSKWNKKKVNYEIIYNKYTVGNYWIYIYMLS